MEMKRFLLFLAVFCVTGLSCHAQDVIVSKDGVGPVKVGMQLEKVPASIPHFYTQKSPLPDYYFWVICENENGDSMASFLGEDEDSDRYETLVYFILESSYPKTKEGLHVGSTCQEILDKGGKRGKLDFGEEIGPVFYVSLEGLYFFFDDQEGVENGKIKTNAPCIKISNSESPYFM